MQPLYTQYVNNINVLNADILWILKQKMQLRQPDSNNSDT